MNIKRRLQKVEESIPPEKPPLLAPWELLSVPELMRLRKSAKAGRLTEVDLARMVATARERQAAGWTRQDAERLTHAERAKQRRVVDLIQAVCQRHGKHLAFERIDVLDLTPTELDELVQLARVATTENELRTRADVIACLRIDGEPVSLAQFASIVLGGPTSP